MLKIAGKITSPKTINAVGKISIQASRASRDCSDRHLFLTESFSDTNVMNIYGLTENDAGVI